MSSRIFKGVVGERSEKGSRYKPGSASAYADLAGRMVEDYLDGTLEDIRWGSRGERIVEAFAPQAAECGDGQGFLDAIVEKLGFFGSIGHLRHADTLISPFINLFYEQGHDTFTLDMTGWARAPEFLAQGLAATEDKPLSLHYKVAPAIKTDSGFDVVYVGWGSEHIALRLSGTAVCSAYNCKNSEFIFEKQVKNIGEESTANCTFRLEDVVGVTELRSSSNVGYNLGIFRGDAEPETVFIDLQFFQHGNRLLIPDSPSTWKAVTFS